MMRGGQVIVEQKSGLLLDGLALKRSCTEIIVAVLWVRQVLSSELV